MESPHQMLIFCEIHSRGNSQPSWYQQLSVIRAGFLFFLLYPVNSFDCFSLRLVEVELSKQWFA